MMSMKIYIRDWFWLCLVVGLMLCKWNTAYEKGREKGFTQGIKSAEPYIDKRWPMVPYHRYEYSSGKLKRIIPLE